MRLAIAHLWDGESAPSGEVVQVGLEVREAGLALAIDAPFHADPIPPGPPGNFDGLWEFEVVELFLLGAGGRYLEVEVGPHGHHLVLELEGRRRVARRGLPLELSVQRGGGRWSGDALVPWGQIPAGALRANAYAIHGVAAARRYLAWAPVPGDGPDFHRLEHFRALDLPGRAGASR